MTADVTSPRRTQPLTGAAIITKGNAQHLRIELAARGLSVNGDINESDGISTAHVNAELRPLQDWVYEDLARPIAPGSLLYFHMHSNS